MTCVFILYTNNEKWEGEKSYTCLFSSEKLNSTSKVQKMKLLFQ